MKWNKNDIVKISFLWFILCRGFQIHSIPLYKKSNTGLILHLFILSGITYIRSTLFSWWHSWWAIMLFNSLLILILNLILDLILDLVLDLILVLVLDILLTVIILKKTKFFYNIIYQYSLHRILNNHLLNHVQHP